MFWPTVSTFLATRFITRGVNKQYPQTVMLPSRKLAKGPAAAKEEEGVGVLHVHKPIEQALNLAATKVRSDVHTSCPAGSIQGLTWAFWVSTFWSRAPGCVWVQSKTPRAPLIPQKLPDLLERVIYMDEFKHPKCTRNPALFLSRRLSDLPQCMCTLFNTKVWIKLRIY